VRPRTSQLLLQGAGPGSSFGSHVRHGLDYDVRFLGSRMRKWMDADVQQALELYRGHFDAADSAMALRASIALFARLCRRIADSLGFRSFNHDRVHREVEAILAMTTPIRQVLQSG
jgi:aminoglycoside 6-adenylyltransferase